MKKMTSEQIIRTYIDFFKEKGHTEVVSASLIPKDRRSHDRDGLRAVPFFYWG